MMFKNTSPSFLEFGYSSKNADGAKNEKSSEENDENKEPVWEKKHKVNDFIFPLNSRKKVFVNESKQSNFRFKKYFS